MGQGLFAEKLLDFEIAKSLTSFQNDQQMRYIPRNHDERLQHLYAFWIHGLIYNRSYHTELDMMLGEFLNYSRNNLFLDGKENSNLTKSALFIRDTAEIFNPFPRGGGKNVRQKTLRRQESAVNGLIFMFLFHPGTKEVFYDAYFKIFDRTPPGLGKNKAKFLEIWQQRYSEDYDNFNKKYSDLVVENHLYLYLMELISSGSYVGKSSVQRYPFMLEIINAYPWYIQSETGASWVAKIRNEGISDFLKLDHLGKKVPRQNPIIDRFSGCLSGYLDVFRGTTYVEAKGEDHPASALRVLISQLGLRNDRCLDSTVQPLDISFQKLRSRATQSLFETIKNLIHKNRGAKEKVDLAKICENPAAREKYLKLLLEELSQDQESCYLLRLLLFRDSLPMFKCLFS